MLTVVTMYKVECRSCPEETELAETRGTAERDAINLGFVKQQNGTWLCERCSTPPPEPEDMKHLRELYGLAEWELPAFLRDADERRRMLKERPYLRLLAEDLEHLIPFYEVFP